FTPHDKRLPGMVRWLLFQRKASQWSSPRASVSAVMALLQYQKSQGALFTPQTLKWDWNHRKETLRLSGKELPPLLRWSHPQPTSSAMRATVEKKGPGLAFASLTAVVTSSQPPTDPPNAPLKVKIEFYA